MPKHFELSAKEIGAIVDSLDYHAEGCANAMDDQAEYIAFLNAIIQKLTV